MSAILQRASEFTKKFVEGNLGSEVCAFSLMVDNTCLLREFHEPMRLPSGNFTEAAGHGRPRRLRESLCQLAELGDRRRGESGPSFFGASAVDGK